MTATMPETEEPVLGGMVPEVDLTDPAELETMYGNYQFFEHYRTAVLAQCHELLRGRYIVEGVKVTEERLKNEARNHPIYLNFLATHYTGRKAREQNVRDSLRGA
jgi:hypothetical protein